MKRNAFPVAIVILGLLAPIVYAAGQTKRVPNPPIYQADEGSQPPCPACPPVRP